MSIEDALARTKLSELLTELSGQPVGSATAPRWRCISPTHADENPSTTVFEDERGKERWKCWSCGHSGTAIDALVEARSMTVSQAIRALEERTGSTDRAASAPRRAKPEGRVTVPLSTDALEYLAACAKLLWKPAGREARNWLFHRGLDATVLRNNLVGFDPGPRRLSRAEGLPGNMTTPDRRRPSLPGGIGVTFAAFDATGQPIHVQCRLLRAHSFKYANPRRAHGSIPPVSFPRSTITTGPLLVAEGVPDALIASTAGFQSAAITAATTITQASAAALMRHANGRQIVLAFDSDAAGRAATAELRGRLSGDVAVLRLPDQHDLTDTYRGNPPTWQTSLTQPTQTASPAAR